ncbi:hypothetical protein GGR53DRAFT_469812 [Hypoxylon sp. FL1150]|nr:hypothetical protein GGR53DRAFT_469812 [Hypoxylon sp. FL1150]
MESYDEFLSEKWYGGMIKDSTFITVIREYELDRSKPTRDNTAASLFSLKQSVIEAEVKGGNQQADRHPDYWRRVVGLSPLAAGLKPGDASELAKAEPSPEDSRALGYTYKNKKRPKRRATRRT